MLQLFLNFNILSFYFKDNNNQNQIENKEVVQIVGESQQVKTIFNYISIIAGFIFIHTTEQLRKSN